MAVVCPNIEDSVTFAAQAVRDSVDMYALGGSANQTGLRYGCAVTPSGTVNAVTIAAGMMQVGNTFYPVFSTTLVNPRGSTNPANADCRDTIVYTPGIGLQWIQGVACGVTGSNWTPGSGAAGYNPPIKQYQVGTTGYVVPQGSIVLAEVYVPYGGTAGAVIPTSWIIDKRCFLSGDARPEFNAFDYGATGNGVTSQDDAPFINAAIAACGAAGGGDVVLEPGNYNCLTPIQLGNGYGVSAQITAVNGGLSAVVVGSVTSITVQMTGGTTQQLLTTGGGYILSCTVGTTPTFTTVPGQWSVGQAIIITGMSTQGIPNGTYVIATTNGSTTFTLTGAINTVGGVTGTLTTTATGVGYITPTYNFSGYIATWLPYLGSSQQLACFAYTSYSSSSGVFTGLSLVTSGFNITGNLTPSTAVNASSNTGWAVQGKVSSYNGVKVMGVGRPGPPLGGFTGQVGPAVKLTFYGLNGLAGPIFGSGQMAFGCFNINGPMVGWGISNLLIDLNNSNYTTGVIVMAGAFGVMEDVSIDAGSYGVNTFCSPLRLNAFSGFPSASTTNTSGYTVTADTIGNSFRRLTLWHGSQQYVMYGASITGAIHFDGSIDTYLSSANTTYNQFQDLMISLSAPGVSYATACSSSGTTLTRADSSPITAITSATGGGTSYSVTLTMTAGVNWTVGQGVAISGLTGSNIANGNYKITAVNTPTSINLTVTTTGAPTIGSGLSGTMAGSFIADGVQNGSNIIKTAYGTGMIANSILVTAVTATTLTLSAAPATALSGASITVNRTIAALTFAYCDDNVIYGLNVISVGGNGNITGVNFDYTNAGSNLSVYNGTTNITKPSTNSSCPFNNAVHDFYMNSANNGTYIASLNVGTPGASATPNRIDCKGSVPVPTVANLIWNNKGSPSYIATTAPTSGTNGVYSVVDVSLSWFFSAISTVTITFGPSLGTEYGLTGTGQNLAAKTQISLPRLPAGWKIAVSYSTAPSSFIAIPV